MRTLNQVLVSGIVGIIVSLVGIKVASAQDCKPPMVFVSGVQEYQGASTANANIIIRGNSAVVRVRLTCADDKTSGVSNDGGLPQTKNVPKAEWAKSGNVSVKMGSAFVEFEGSLSVTEPGSKLVTFTVSPTESYSITFDFRKSFAESGDSYTKPESDARYPKKEDVHSKDEANARFRTIDDSYSRKDADDRFCNKTDGSCTNSGEGRYTLLGGGMVFARPDWGTAGGAQLYLGLRFARPTTTVFELGIVGNAAFAGTKIPVRDVQGIPTTSPVADQQIFTLGVLPSASVYMFDKGVFLIGGGLGLQYLHTPEWTVGNDPSTQRQWFWKTQDEFSLLLMANVGFRFQLSDSPSPAPSLMVGVTPGVQLVGTKNLMGGDKSSHQWQFPIALSLGIQM